MTIVGLLICSLITFTSCSSDDDEGATGALHGNNLHIDNGYKYIDGEKSGIYTYNMLLQKDGSVDLFASEFRMFDSAKWHFSGNNIVVEFYDNNELARTDNWQVEAVYGFGRFVLRQTIDELIYARVPGTIDSDAYDDAEDPDWWNEEWH